MRSLIACLTVFMLLCASSGVGTAQDERGVIGKGLKVGLNLAKFGGNDASGPGLDPGFRTGIQAGGFVTVGLGPSFALQPELFYAEKGCKYEESGDKVIFKVAYLEMPVLAKWMIPTASEVTPSVFAGPAVGIKLRSRLKAESGGASAEVNLDNVKDFEAGLVLGAGVDVPMTRGKVVFEARYNLGLTGLAGKDEVDMGLEDTVDLKNRTLNFLVGYAF